MIPYQGLLTQKIFKLLSANVHAEFNNALHNPFFAQQKVLSHITSSLVNTEYGRYYHLTKQASYEQYAKHIPIVNYEDISSWIEKSKFQQQILTASKIDFFEKTSGSVSHKKSIPYTKSLRANFSHCFKIWGYDCLNNGLTFNSLKIFMSISPLLSKDDSQHHQDDSDYLKGLLRFLIRPYLLKQANIHALKDSNDFRFILALTLAAQQNLELISIWSPSYLLVLLSIIEERFDEILYYLNKGDFVYKKNLFTVPSLSKKRKTLIASFKTNVDFELLWPQLKLISCWTQGTSSLSARKLQQLFHKTQMQGKGLLATEAPITIPYFKAHGYVPLVNDIFLEFEDKSNNIFRVHELKVDEEYELIISQNAGLYRYRMGDFIRVTHFYQNTPCFEFIGRTTDTCDLVGEKLNERFVANLFSKSPFDKSQCLLLVPTMQDSGQGKYFLLTDDKNIAEKDNELDRYLSQAFHYANARKMLQLLTPEILFHPHMKIHIYQIMESLGIKMGDQKETSLIISPQIGEKLVHSLVMNKG